MASLIQAAYALGFAMSLGTILSLIVMSATVGSDADATLVFHQRHFASRISRLVTVPGMFVLLAVSIAALASIGTMDGWRLAAVACASALVINTLFGVVPMLRRTTAIAQAAARTGAAAVGYAALKAREDRHGGLNLLLLSGLVVIVSLTPINR